MATQYIQFGYTSGQTLAVKLISLGGEAVLFSSATAIESPASGGIYKAAFTEVSAINATYRAVITLSGTGVASYEAKFTGTDAEIIQATEFVNVEIPAGGDATAANQQEILTRLSNPIVRVHQDEFGLGFLQLFSSADYDDIAHKRKRWLVDPADTDLTGFSTGSLVITDTRTQTVQVTITDAVVHNAGTSLQGVSVGILQANTANLSVGLKYNFKLTMINGSNKHFVVDEGRLEMLR